MAHIPFSYNLRSLRVRWRSSLATLAGIALVVAVFVIVMALARGLRTTFTSTGDPRNLLVTRKGAMAESSSQITLEDVRRTRYLEGIERTPEGEPLASAEVIVLITLERFRGGSAHVQVRGLGPLGPRLRPDVQIIEGRMFKPGARECIVSRQVSRRFNQCQLGQGFRSGKGLWQVVGIFDARKTAYESEIWMDADEAKEAFNRSFYCSITLRPVNPAVAEALIHRIDTDKQLQLRALSEPEYYREQTKTAGPIQVFGFCLAAIMGLGAAFSAMNTMYASIGSRTREIGTLRVLGFSRRSIYLSFMLESIAVALAGGLIGCALSFPINGLATGTFNWATFAEVAFEFRITGELLASGLAFALVMGILGGLLPASAAARQPILAALRAG